MSWFFWPCRWRHVVASCRMHSHGWEWLRAVGRRGGGEAPWRCAVRSCGCTSSSTTSAGAHRCAAHGPATAGRVFDSTFVEGSSLVQHCWASYAHCIGCVGALLCLSNDSAVLLLQPHSIAYALQRFNWGWFVCVNFAGCQNRAYCLWRR